MREQFRLICNRFLTFIVIHRVLISTGLVSVIIIFWLSYSLFFAPPRTFPIRSIVTITEGSSLTNIAEQLEKQHIIRSAFVLRLLSVLNNVDGGVLAGDYYFHGKVNVLSVARMITTGDFGQTPIKIRILEGATTRDIAELFDSRFVYFNKQEFISLTEEKEGYLFPDTYQFLPSVRTKKVIGTLESNFNKKITQLEAEIFKFGVPVEEVIIMASILEKEAWRTETRRTIAGILWNRIAIGMPLQVDATFAYINGKNTFELTLEDLKIDSPYNTYKYPGLPVGPIANPGLDSLRAAVTPIESDFLFYLSDLEGNTYYTETFEEHKINKAKYLP